MVRPIVRPVASTTRRETLDGLPVDPHNRYLDKLPQPFRRIDKLVAELIEGALDVAWEREAKAREEAARPKTAAFVPSVKYSDLGDVVSFAISKDGRHMFVGNKAGELLVIHLPSRSVVVRSAVHPGPVERVAVTYTQGATLLVSASKELVCVYTVGFERSLLTLVCSCKPPSSSRASLVAQVSCSPDGKYLTCACTDGSMALYEVPKLPKPGAEAEDPPPVRHLLWLPASHVQTLVGMPAGPPTAALLFVPRKTQPKPRPESSSADNNTTADRSGGGAGTPRVRSAARRASDAATVSTSSTEEVLNGVYVSWQGCNRLMFFELEDVITGGATGEQQRGAAEGERECSLPDRDWTMPYPVTCACLMSAEMLLFVGLHDGSTIIWDCHLVTQVGVLKRMGGAVTAIAYVDRGEGNGALVGSSEGELILVNLETLHLQTEADADSVVELTKPCRADGPIHAILPMPVGALVVLLRPDCVIEMYDINTSQTIGEFKAGDKSAFLTDVHASSLYNTGVSGLLVVGTVQTSESDPNNRGISVGNVPTIEEEEDPDPEAEDGQPKERKARLAEEVVIFNVQEAYEFVQPQLANMGSVVGNPMLQRMLADTDTATHVIAEVEQTGGEAAHVLSSIATGSARPGSLKKKGGDRRGNTPTERFKRPQAKDLEKIKGDPVELIMERIQQAADEGRDERMRRLQTSHAAMAAKFAAEAGINTD